MNPETIINKATIYYFLGKYDQAESLTNSALELSERDANALILLSLIEVERNNFPSALAEINRALDEVPGEAYFLNNRGFIYLERSLILHIYSYKYNKSHRQNYYSRRDIKV